MIEKISTSLTQLLNAEQAWHYECIVVAKKQNELVIATYEGSTADLSIAELRILLNSSIRFSFYTEDEILQLIAFNYRANKEKESSHLNMNSGDNISDLIWSARNAGSSDIHIEIFDGFGRVRFRVDGKLVEKSILKTTEFPALVNKIKIQSKLDISEKRLPQDGRMQVKNDVENIELRVSILPTLHGEKIVLRILESNADHLNINDIGFNSEQKSVMIKSITKPNGIILISGPTGSGKTTTLYGLLKKLNSVDVNIITIENPIEYTLQGVNQIQVNSSIGLTFSSALKSVLRQDPDIIMLGEIRDSETAELAVRASLTGHLVLSTIHTNNAWGIISRLVDMGIPSFLLKSVLNVAVAQRLIRKLCDHCKIFINSTDLANYLSDYPLIKEKKKDVSYYKSAGCAQCHYTGYKGRVGIFEVIPVNNELKSVLDQDYSEVKSKLFEMGVKSIEQEALDLVYKGVTDVKEVYPFLV